MTTGCPEQPGDPEHRQHDGEELSHELDDAIRIDQEGGSLDAPVATAVVLLLDPGAVALGISREASLGRNVWPSMLSSRRCRSR